MNIDSNILIFTSSINKTRFINELCESRALKDIVINTINTRDSFIYSISYNKSRALIIKETSTNKDAFIDKIIKDIKRNNRNNYNKIIVILIDIKRVERNISKDKLIE